MTHIKIRNRSKYALLAWLKRRKTTLKEFLVENSIQTYEQLTNWCDKTGLEAPTSEEFARQKIPAVTDHSEGIVVIGVTQQELLAETSKKKKKKSADPENKE